MQLTSQASVCPCIGRCKPKPWIVDKSIGQVIDNMVDRVVIVIVQGRPTFPYTQPSYSLLAHAPDLQVEASLD